MATLFLGRSIHDPAAPPVAIKVIHEHLSSDWQFVRMFVDEALISVRLRHPNVIRVDELGEQNNVYFLVMEYVHGCSLAQLLQAMAQKGRRMRPELAVWIAQQVAAGLHAAHEMTGHDGAVLGVIHRDISPQNVLLSVDGEVKLLDFGVAKARGRAERTEAGVIKGKVRYMAPEQAMGNDIDRRIDIYALGIVLWEMLTMRRYIEGRGELEILRKVQSPEPVPPSFRVDGIDPRIDDAVMAAIAPHIERRPPTAAHLLEMLTAAVPEGTVGPAQIAELLRLFVADRIEAAARALPAEVGNDVAERLRELGADVNASDETTRVETLTRRVASASVGESDDESGATLATKPGRVGIEAEEDARASPDPSRPSGEHARYDQAEDEPTLEASAPELSQFLERMRSEAASASTEPAPNAAPAVAPELVSAHPPPTAPTTPDPSAGSSRVAFVARVLLMTLVAFAVGAGAAIAWLHWGSP